MHFNKKYFLVLIIVFGFIFLGQFRDNGDFSFYLSTSKIFSTNENPTIQVETYSFSGMINFRLYKITNPVEYFENLKDPHNPDIKNLNSSNVFNVLRSSFKKVSRDIRLAARDIMKSESRKELRDILDISESKDSVKKEPVTEIPKELVDYPVITEWKEEIKQSSEYWNYHTVNIKANTPGVYLVEGKVSGRKVGYTVVVVSDYAMITKNSENNILAFVANKKSGNLISDFPLNFYIEKTKIQEKSTDNQGMMNLTYQKPEKNKTEESEFDPWTDEYQKKLLMGYKDEQFVISEPYFYSYYASQSKYNVYLYTERPVYRPGQEVYLKGIFRSRDKDGNWQNFNGKFVKIKINDPRGNPVYEDSLKTNDFGSVNTKLKLEQEAVLGNYWIETLVEGNSYSSSFEVQEYKKPEYEVAVNFDKEFYVKGNQIKAEVKANYYFGSPVANAEVEFFIYRSRYYRPWWLDSEYEWLFAGEDEDYEYNSELVESGTGKLDSEGKYYLSYYTDANNTKDYIYKITANVVDESRRSISGSRRVKVMRGYYTLTVNTDKYVYSKNDIVSIKVIAEDFGKKPVMTNFQAKVIVHSYKQIEKWVNGQKTYEYKTDLKNIETLYGATDNSGVGYVNFKPKENGYFEVMIYSKDQKGNEITESDYIYVSDADYQAYWGGESSGSIKIIPDKAAYAAGETMKALIVVPAPNIDVLVTSEREDIISSQVEHFNGTSKVVEIPIKANFAPNIYLNASILFNNNYFTQTKKIIIPSKDKFMNIKIIHDKETYKPGEKGKLTVEVTSANNKPVKNAELSVGVVDESIYAIAPENTMDIKKQYYSVRPNQVQTSSSLFFNFYGYSRDIRQDEYADLYGQKEQKNNFANVNQRQRIALGDIKGEKFVEPSVRKDFRDMISWNPTVVTDGNGRAEINIQYPDNLTAWRTTVRGITQESEVGSATKKTITRKNLILRLETPRFFIQKDYVSIAAIIHNYLNSDKQVDLSLSGTNIDVIEGHKKIRVPKNGQVRVDIKVNTANYFGDAKLLGKALTNEESDAVELTVPILPHGIQVAESQVLSLEYPSETKNSNFTIPENSNLWSSQFYVSLSPSLASSVLGSLDELVGYPYGCVEQTMSRFLPTVVVSNTMQELGVPVSDKMKAEIPKMVEKGLQRLYSFQHSDGGWGWWKDDQTDAFMTAYVVYGLELAKRAKFDIDINSLSRGMWNLKWWVDNKKDLDVTTRAYILYVLSFANEREKILENQIINNHLANIQKWDLNNYSLSLIALANFQQGNKNEAYAFAGQLEGDVSYDGSNAFWRGKTWHYNWQDDEVETTAYALKALINMKKDDQIIQKGINWLLSRKFGSSWNSTKQTAMVIFALIDYLKNSTELNPDYTVKVYVNDRMAFEKRITKADVFVKESRNLIDHSVLKSGENKIRVEKYGNGKLYYTSRIMYYTGEENIQSKSAGFAVTREYYKLTLQKQGEKMVYLKSPLNGTIKSGDLIFVKLRMTASSPNEYFMLEDPIPAGCEVILNTQGYILPGEPGFEQSYYYNWQWWWASREVRDEKVTFFARNVYAGTYNFTYIVRAQIPGDYHIMPSQACLMYYPEVRGNSDERTLKIIE